MGDEGSRRRGCPAQHEAADFKCQKGSDLERSSRAREKLGRCGRAGEGGPYLVLRVLEHVAHAALVLLEAEEDIPQPQSSQKYHEDIERQVPEVD